MFFPGTVSAFLLEDHDLDVGGECAARESDQADAPGPRQQQRRDGQRAVDEIEVIPERIDQYAEDALRYQKQDRRHDGAQECGTPQPVSARDKDINQGEDDDEQHYVNRALSDMQKKHIGARNDSERFPDKVEERSDRKGEKNETGEPNQKRKFDTCPPT